MIEIGTRSCSSGCQLKDLPRLSLGECLCVTIKKVQGMTKEEARLKKHLEVFKKNRVVIPTGYVVKSNGTIASGDLFYNEQTGDWDTPERFVKKYGFDIVGNLVTDHMVPIITVQPEKVFC